MRRWMFGLSTLVGMTALVMACGVGSDCDFGLCAGPAAGGDGGDGSVDTDANPSGCESTKEQKEQPACQNDEFAVFVAPTGTPEAKGTQDAPVNTITRALALIGGKRNRIFVCEGSYVERVTLSKPVNIYGGFSCAAKPWAAGAKAVIGKLQEPGYALDVQSVAGGFEIVDLEFVAGNGGDTFPNSVAARFVGTTGATLKRIKLTANNGLAGRSGDIGIAGNTAKHSDLAGAATDPAGNPGTTATPGGAKGCRCSSAPSTEITSGGNGGLATTGAGVKGEPSTLPPTGSDDGAGGPMSAVGCAAGSGHNGASRAQATGGAVPTRLGTIDASDWKAEAGGSGATGLPGQGGGGGNGQASGTGGCGSGGGCGGCGGFGGKGGAGGGASIALMAIDSPIHVTGELATGIGGRGGNGGDGGTGGDGGSHGPVTSGTGCPGGDGGKGGRGGDGAGGAGGLSVGVLSSGMPPTTDGVTFTLKAAGDGGTGKSGNSGPPGVKAQTATVEVVSTKPGM